MSILCMLLPDKDNRTVHVLCFPITAAIHATAGVLCSLMQIEINRFDYKCNI